MKQRILTAAGVLALGGWLAACDDFLSGPGLDTDPNRPSQATIAQLYQGVQVNSFVWFTGDLARVASMWNQLMAGTGRQQQTRDLYEVTEVDFDFDFSRIYTGGGLIDLREIQRLAGESGDRTYAGIAKVWEAYKIGMAASLWGDIPYSEAVGENPKPVLDDQAAVYAAVQTLLNNAIADLQAAAGAGPGVLDQVYGGDRTKWIQAANTLKARFYMHWVEAQLAGGASATRAATACGGNCLTAARTAALSGISSAANDMRTFHTTTAGEQNLWFQFMNIARQGDIAAGERLVELLKDRSDPRLEEYFAPVGSGQYIGAPPGTELTASQLNPAGRGAADFRQPLVTYAENQLILAEANYRLGAEGTALTHLNNARTSEGLAALGALTGPALLTEIALEKYIALFQNIEAWNDHKRLCEPALTPAAGAAVLPGRLFYGEDERNTNPNIPSPGSITDRNDNDPNPCPVPPGDS
ncbi:MAG TPA: SusD/RagB family nutrient-binding outer membrane lipoprotein [Longimicrobiaceae bacterium]|nr:SusD/RagB family nutrient-binding outer membrane lipoprotein [Longimicrobiaceae bacterium]